MIWCTKLIQQYHQTPRCPVLWSFIIFKSFGSPKSPALGFYSCGQHLWEKIITNELFWFAWQKVLLSSNRSSCFAFDKVRFEKYLELQKTKQFTYLPRHPESWLRDKAGKLWKAPIVPKHQSSDTEGVVTFRIQSRGGQPRKVTIYSLGHAFRRCPMGSRCPRATGAQGRLVHSLLCQLATSAFATLSKLHPTGTTQRPEGNTTHWFDWNASFGLSLSEVWQKSTSEKKRKLEINM